MTPSTPPTETAPPVAYSMDLRELTRALIQHHRIHSGFFELSVSYEITVGGFTTPSGQVLPGTMQCINGVALLACKADNPLAVNAAEVNPAPASAA